MQEIPAEKIKKQFDLLGDIDNNPILIDYIQPKIEGRNITFQNDVKQNDATRSLKAQKYFNYVKQYVAFFKSRSYQFLFSDYSLGRIVYEFDDNNKLVSYNMYWNPCPFNEEFIKELANVGMDIAEYIDCIDDTEKAELNAISLKSPLRFDYAREYTGKYKGYHPSLHLHIQDSETRMKVSSAFSVYKYYLFILENCFPSIYKEGKYEDYIEHIRKLDLETSGWLKVKSDDSDVGNQIQTEIRSK